MKNANKKRIKKPGKLMFVLLSVLMLGIGSAFAQVSGDPPPPPPDDPGTPIDGGLSILWLRVLPMGLKNTVTAVNILVLPKNS